MRMRCWSRKSRLSGQTLLLTLGEASLSRPHLPHLCPEGSQLSLSYSSNSSCMSVGGCWPTASTFSLPRSRKLLFAEYLGDGCPCYYY